MIDLAAFDAVVRLSNGAGAGYTTCFILHSAGHEIVPANKRQLFDK